MVLFTDEGLIIRRHTFGEGDVLFVVFTKNHGKVRLVAKGVRKVGSRRSGHLSLFNQIEFQARAGGEIKNITEVSSINTFESLKSQTDVAKYVYYIAELLDNFLQDDDKHYSLYLSTIDTLITMSSTESLFDIESIVEDFEIALLQNLGFWSDDVQGRVLPNDKLERRDFMRNYIHSIIGKELNSLKTL